MGAEKINTADMETAYEILKECSMDSQHYLSFNEENTFFFGAEVYGMIAYTLAGKKSMSIGDPVCRPEDMERLTAEYVEFCRTRKYKPVFNSVSSSMADILKKKGFRVLHYGDEAILNLPDYNLAGKYRAALRRNVNNVNKSGVTLLEYKPQQERDYELEEKINEIAEQWFAGKSYRLGYTIGALDFEQPYDRRFFVTMDENGDLLTVLSFLPYECGRSFCIDVMYRKLNSITGAMEHAIVSAAMQMKDEGIDKMSLSIAPLSGIDVSRPGVSRAEKLMNAVFHNMDSGYNFKNLYRFKKKFHPVWESRYLVYHSDISVLNVIMSITNRKRGATDIVLYAKYAVFLIAYMLGRFREDKGSSA